MAPPPSTSPARLDFFHLMAKPSGAACNLGCRYCFYLEKKDLYPGQKLRMDEQVMERYVRACIEEQTGPEITITWQGGEPTLLGIEFFEKAVAFAELHRPPNRKLVHSLQTNGTLLDEAWCRFLKKHDFLVGISIDGPKELHDGYRRRRDGGPTWKRVVESIKLCQRIGVEFNALTVVHRENARKPLLVYRFLRDLGVQFIQFIPLVERVDGDGQLLGPPDLRKKEDVREAAPWCPRPEDYGEFLCAIFDDWVRQDVGKVFVQMFDVALGLWATRQASLCHFAETCGGNLALEHNGDLYRCDHYVYPEHRLGNIREAGVHQLALRGGQHRFGADKRDTLPGQCQGCDVRFACNGGCPKHRFAVTADGEPGLNWLCAAYQRFFRHVDPAMRKMTELLEREEPPALIMNEWRRPALPEPVLAAAMEGPQISRNARCPCGSGKRYKRCCGRKR